MRRMVTVAAAILLLAPCMADATDATGSAPEGVRNTQKVMQKKLERYQKIQEVKKRAHAQKQAQREAHSQK